MARQTFWKGYLKLSLVTAAVSLTPATTESNKVRFHVLNRQTKNRIESRYVDSVTHKPVAERDGEGLSARRGRLCSSRR